jgi:sugar phosphate isomerase/epimerase
MPDRKMHDRLSVSGLCFPGRSATATLDAVAQIGAGHTTLQLVSVDQDGPEVVRTRREDLGVTVEALIGGGGPALNDQASWPGARERLVRAVDTAVGVGARSIYMLTGARLDVPWDDAVARFAAFMGPCLDYAAAAGVALAVEPANVLYADLTFVHSAATAFALARDVPGLRVCLDLFHTWTEFDLKQNIMAEAARISLVQVSDYALGDRSLPARAVPGDGGVPIEGFVAWLGQAGYHGIIDLELNGPRIDAEGHLAAARRGAEALSRILGRHIPA